MNKNGITLVAVIMIIILLIVIVGGITSYITERLRLNASNINQAKALYMAQAGIMSGIVDYKADGLWSPQSDINVTGEFYYSIGESANFLLVDASNILANGRIINRWPIKNINASSSITINSLIVSWTFGGNIKAVKLGGVFVFNGPAAPSPAAINISPAFIIASGASYNGTNDQYLQFDSNVSGTASITFNFSDGSSFKTYLLKNGNKANNEFSLKSTGKIKTGSTVEARRTLVATYDIATNNFTSWEESTGFITP